MKQLLLSIFVVLPVIIGKESASSGTTKSNGHQTCPPILKNPVKSKTQIWAALNDSCEKRMNVLWCHYNYTEMCYNGFYPLQKQGYRKEDIKTICAFYRHDWRDCCNNSTNRTRWGPEMQAYCPLYIGSCNQLEEEFLEMERQNISIQTEFNRTVVNQFRSPVSQTQFGKDCPNFTEKCLLNDSQVAAAVKALTFCDSWEFMGAKKNCSSVEFSCVVKKSIQGPCERYHRECR